MQCHFAELFQAECYCAECHYAVCLQAECYCAECHYAECLQAECYCAECHYAECHFAECRSTVCASLCYQFLLTFPEKKTTKTESKEIFVETLEHFENRRFFEKKLIKDRICEVIVPVPRLN